MSPKRNKAIELIRKLVVDLTKHIPISKAYLFGSYAKGQPSRWSDIDVALVSKKFKGVRFYDYKMLLPYLRGHSNSFEIHPFKQADFTAKNLFVKEIIESGIKIKP